jgi:hypothetical protein
MFVGYKVALFKVFSEGIVIVQVSANFFSSGEQLVPTFGKYNYMKN